MDIRINRESVCLGDDMLDHSLEYRISPRATFHSICCDLIMQRYFPGIAGNDVVWALTCKGQDLIAWKTKENRLYSRFTRTEPAILDCPEWQDIQKIFFRYYSPPVKRAKHIYQIHGGRKPLILLSGFMLEYESYNIPRSIEMVWQKELSTT